MDYSIYEIQQFVHTPLLELSIINFGDIKNDQPTI